MAVTKLQFLTFLAFLSSAYSNSCTNPEVTSKSFTTLDATIVTSIAYIAEFNLECKSEAISHLYVETDGVIVPVSEIAPNRFQVSWTEEIKSARNGDISLKVFDEEGYTALRKAIRAGKDLSTVSPFVTVIINHPGAFTGPWLKSEFLATALAVIVAYVALSSRSKLLS